MGATARVCGSRPLGGLHTTRSELDWQPSLNRLQQLTCTCWATVAAAIVWQLCQLCTTSYLLHFPLALTAGACAYSLVRGYLLEAQYQGKQRMEVDLADKDSHFHHIANVKVHVKCTTGAAARASRKPHWTFHCYHGFGSNTYTWSLVQPKLATAANALVTAHDMPGFGLTQRPPRVSDYCLAFNGLVGRLINDRELAALDELKCDGAHGGKTTSFAVNDAEGSVSEKDVRSAGAHVWKLPSKDPSAPPRRVLIGHSIGGACAALETVAHVEGLHALVLVAPAIPSFPSPEHEMVELQRVRCSGIPGTGQGGVADVPCCHLYIAHPKEPVGVTALDGSNSKQTSRTGEVFAAIMQVFVVCLLVWLIVLQPVMLLLVRNVVRTKAFWTHLLHQAHFDKATVTPNLVDAYRMPQLVRKFEVGVIKFLIALPNSLNLAPWTFMRGMLQGSWREKLVASRLARRVAATGLPVLIIHGTHDKVIPLSNSMRLACSIPGCQLVEVQRCGHVPQEEHPDLFVHILQAFLEGALSQQH